MKVLVFTFILAFFFAPKLALQAQEQEQAPKKLENYKLDLNAANIDRIEKVELYLEKFSSGYNQLKQEFELERAEHQKTKEALLKMSEALAKQESERLKELEAKVAALETEIKSLELPELKKNFGSADTKLNDLKKDYDQAKAMLEQIKLLIQADYASRFSTTDSGNNKLKGIVEEINKIQLPKPTPTPTTTPSTATTPTPTPTVGAATTSTPTPTPTPTTSPSAEENFIEKYPLPVRQSFCRKPENLKQYQKECLPYL